MRWLSKGFEQIAENPGEKPDVVVIGSGYGGAVAAARFAAAGLRVFVLERGREYRPGEFPTDVSTLPRHLRISRAEANGIVGEPDGLFELNISRDAIVLTGNALGGGSQINAAVALRADPQVFRQAAWPREFRETEAMLNGSYAIAEAMLEVVSFPVREGQEPKKHEALRRLAEPVADAIAAAHNRPMSAEPERTAFYAAPLAVRFARDGANAHGVMQKECIRCGECVAGCNYSAKNTLTENYLPVARKHGAEIFTEVTVTAIQPLKGGGARVWYSPTIEETVDKHAARGGVPFMDHELAIRQNRYIDAPIVVVAAGSIGSAGILIRSRETSQTSSAATVKGRGADDQVLPFHPSPRLGKGFSGNGDGLAFGVDGFEVVNGVGRGNIPPRGRAHTVGPTITGVIDTRPGVPLEKGVLIEDGAIPSILASYFRQIVGTSASLAQFGRWFRHGEYPDVAGLSRDVEARTQTYLLIGHDNADGEIQLKRGRPTVHWPDAKHQPQRMRQIRLAQLTERFGGTYVGSPVQQPVPDALSSVFNGPPIEGPPVIVHPLGGCAMADGYADGVVNHMGEVFDGEGADTVYGGLFVWDGSILPTSLGANPMLTIAALAERNVGMVLERIRRRKTRVSRDSSAFQRSIPQCFERERSQAQSLLAYRRIDSPQVRTQRNIAGALERQRREKLATSEKPQTFQQSNLDVALLEPVDVKLAPVPSSLDKPVLIWRETFRGPIKFEGRDVQAMLRLAFRLDVETQARNPGARIKLVPDCEIAEAAHPEREAPLKRPDDTSAPEEFFGLRTSDPNGAEQRTFNVVDGEVRLLEYGSGMVWRWLTTPFNLVRALGVWLVKRRVEVWSTLRRIVASKLGWPKPDLALGAILTILALTGVFASAKYVFPQVLRFSQYLHDHPSLFVAIVLAPCLILFFQFGVAKGGNRRILSRIWRYLRNRLADCFPARDLDAERSTVTFRKYLWSLLCLAKHAGEERRFVYKVRLQDAKDKSQITLIGVKRLRYSINGNVWDDLTRLHFDGWGFKGTMDLDAVALSEGDRPTLLKPYDLPNAFLGFAVLPLLFLRALLPIYVWDFRLPDYQARTRRRVFLPDALAVAALQPDGPNAERVLVKPSTDEFWQPERFWFDVDKRASDAVERTQTGKAEAGEHQHCAKIPLLLTRYRYADSPENGPILLLHGFGQSSLSFAGKMKGPNLVQHLCAHGYDVWLLDHRTSTALPSSRGRFTLDDVAELDIHDAIDVVCKKSGKDKIAVLGHCMGGASLMMALFSDVEKKGRLREKISKIVISQVPPFIVGGSYSQARRQVAAFLRDGLGIDGLDLSADDGATLMWTLLDRLFATFPVQHEPSWARQAHNGDRFDERCPGERDWKPWNIHRDVASCKRVQAIVGRTFLHKNISPEVHETLGDYFGWCNLDIFDQIAKFFEYERLTNADGMNVYVTDENIAGLASIPIQFLHGEENSLFLKTSSEHSHREFVRVNGSSLYELKLLKNTAHFDWLIGNDEIREPAFQAVTNFLKRPCATDVDPVEKLQLDVPAVGPVVGWVRREGEQVLVRIWAQPDTLRNGVEASRLIAVRYDARGNADWIRSAPVLKPFAGLGIDKAANDALGHAWIDVPVADLAQGLMVRVGFAVRRKYERSEALASSSVGTNHDEVERLFDRAVRRTPPPVATLFACLDARLQEVRKGLSFETRRIDTRADRLATYSENSIVRIRSGTLEAHLCSADTDPTLRFFVGSCMYPGFLIDAHRADAMFEAVSKQEYAGKPSTVFPAFMALTGDLIYADAAAGLFDVTSRVEKYPIRYRKAFRSPSFAKVARTLPLYMIPDDHEIDNNWDRSKVGPRPESAKVARWGIDAAEVFEFAHGPNAVGTGRSRVASSTFPSLSPLRDLVAAGFPVALFDARSQRDRTPGSETIGDIDALVTWLIEKQNDKKVQDRPKIVITGSVFLPGIKDHDYAEWKDGQLKELGAYPSIADNWQGFPVDRAKVINAIAENDIDNVVFVSGDYHCGAFGSGRMSCPSGKNVAVWSVVAPALYAPLPFANLPGDLLVRRGVIKTGKGYELSYSATRHAAEGFADVVISLSKNGVWKVRMRVRNSKGAAVHSSQQVG
jgi:choline dehydrogenase-like flavoprotein/pimeloyl-ACP methyl ester carboxylesterase